MSALFEELGIKPMVSIQHSVTCVIEGTTSIGSLASGSDSANGKVDVDVPTENGGSATPV
jgi:hypothetical protein